MKRITAEYIYTLASEPIRNGFVEYEEDGTITAVGQCEDGEEVMSGAIVPGFVNAHCHVELSHLHKKFRKGTGMAGFIDQINELRDWAGREVKQQLVQEWMDKMWNDGVSAMADISNDDSSFDIKKSHKMYTRTFLEVFGSEPEMCEGVMNDVTALKAVADEAGIDAAPTPHSCYTMSPQLLSASAAAGLESGYLSYHSQESQEEEDLLISGSGAMYENRKRSGMSTPPVTGESSLKYFLDRLADVKPAPYDENILLVHNVCLQQSDIDAVKQTMNNAYFAICPLSNIFIHNALPPIDLMRKNGLAIALGTDSLSSNDDLDVMKELVCLQQSDIDAVKQTMNNAYFAICPLSNIFIHNALPPIDLMRKNGLAIALGTDSLSSNDDLDVMKELVCLHENFPQVPMNELFTWASRNGARFLGKDNVLGSIAAGKRPGIVHVSGIDENGCITAESRSRRII